MEEPQLQYEIRYVSENFYTGSSREAHLQFLIIPETNDTQEIQDAEFHNNLKAPTYHSINGLGFETLRLSLKNLSEKVVVSARFQLTKNKVNPFEFDSRLELGSEILQHAEFKATYAHYLALGFYTQISLNKTALFAFDPALSVFENAKNLNGWCHNFLEYVSHVTSTKTTVNELLQKPQGVCQDYAHLYCAMARRNGIPVRYVSGYLHQGAGLIGSARLHAWVEVMIPGIGWLGFDPTNDLLVNTHYIKICHGRNYQDCAPVKGIVYGAGSNQTDHSVHVSVQQ